MKVKRRPGVITTELKKKDGTAWIEYPELEKIRWLRHAFSTRTGGVSPAPYGGMNLSFTVGDSSGNVRENFRLFGEAAGIPAEDMVLAHQTHTSNVISVGSRHRGMGIFSERDFHDVDGLVTDEPDVCLVTSHADCVPLFFVDTVHHVIALAHAGWRGTAGDICGNTVALMEQDYGCNAADITACIGPCVCEECYEVGAEVADTFSGMFHGPEREQVLHMSGTASGKYLLDLAQANRLLMMRHGIPPERIILPDLCTRCNAHLLHSHRATGGRRGGMCAFLMLHE